MEFNLKKSFNYLFFWLISSLFPSLAGADTATAAVTTKDPGLPVDSAPTTQLLPDAVWLIALALIALVAITRRKLK